MGVVAEVADRVVVMYAGKVVETGPVDDLFEQPAHPYTIGLLASIPRAEMGDRLVPIPGQPPDLSRIPKGCAFHPRCPFARDVCRTETPVLHSFAEARATACHIYEEVMASGSKG